MSKFDRINEEMSYSEAETYIDDFIEHLEDIYRADEPENGKAGMIWRTIWDKPRKITPMALFLSEKHIEEILAGVDSKKESLKRANKKAKIKISEAESDRDIQRIKAKLERQKNTELSDGLEEASKYKKAYEVGHANAMNKDIKYLIDRCEKAGSPVNFDDLHSFAIGKGLSNYSSREHKVKFRLP